jgi:tetratricopeptide (TPR) repeat protein
LAAASFFNAQARAQDSDEAWKNLVMQALYAAGANNFTKSEQIFQRALHEAERFGPVDPRVGTTLNSLGLVYKAEKRLPDAESSFRRALTVLEKAYGFDSIDVANVNFNIASVLVDQGKQQAAVPFMDKSLATYKRQLGPGSLKVASVLCMAGDAHRATKSWQEAEPPLLECARIREAAGGVLSPEFGDALFSLAQVYEKQGKYAAADSRFRLAEKIREKNQGITSPALADVLEAHSAMLKIMGKTADAEKDAVLAAAIRRGAQKSK